MSCLKVFTFLPNFILARRLFHVLAQDRKWFLDQGSFVKGVSPVLVWPYVSWAIAENIHPPPPLWTTLNWVPKNFSISKKDRSILCRIPNFADSKSWGSPEFWKILNGFAGNPIKIHKILGKFVEFQSGSPSIYYKISNVVHGGGLVWIFSGIAHCIASKTGKKFPK